MSALDDRRQRAREAGWDAIVDVGAREALETAIETATRVRITGEMRVEARAAVGPRAFMTAEALDALLAAAFQAAGFEVEE